MRSSNGADDCELDELDESVPGSLFGLAVVGVAAAVWPGLLPVDDGGASDAVVSPSPLTCGTTTSDDDTDPAGPEPVPLVAPGSLATVVVGVEVFVRCNAARTDEGDSGAGR